MLLGSLLALQLSISQVELPHYSSADGFCAEHLQVLTKVRKLSLSAAKSMSFEEWQSFFNQLRGLLVDPQPLLDLDQEFTQGLHRTKDKFILPGGMPKNQFFAPRGQMVFDGQTLRAPTRKQMALEFDWGFVRDLWIPTFIRLLHKQQSDFRTHRLLGVKEESLLSAAFPWSIWNRQPPPEISYDGLNIHDLSDDKRTALRNWLNMQASLVIGLEIFDELGNNLESQRIFVEAIRLFDDPLVRAYADQDEKSQKIVESLKSRQLPFSMLRPNSAHTLRPAFIRVSAVFDLFFQKLFERNFRSELKWLQPKRTRDGSWILLGSHFQLQVFESSSGQIERVRFRFWPLAHLQAIQKPMPESPVVELTTSPVAAPSSTPTQPNGQTILTGKNDRLYRWHELLKPSGFTNSRLHRFDPLHTYLDGNEAFVEFVLTQALHEYADLLEDPTFFERTMTMLRSALRSVNQVPDAERVAKIYQFFENRRALLKRQSTDIENLLQTNGNLNVQISSRAGSVQSYNLPDSFQTSAWYVAWRDVVREFEQAGWYLDRRHGSHYLFKHPRSSKTILLPYQGKDFPTMWARQRWQEAVASLQP